MRATRRGYWGGRLTLPAVAAFLTAGFFLFNAVSNAQADEPRLTAPKAEKEAQTPDKKPDTIDERAAKNAGLADLDKATDAKLNAERLGDLAEVIRLCQSALAKGLDKENTTFANGLLASTLVQRATLTSGAIFQKGPPNPLWPSYRRLSMVDLDEAVKLVPNHPDALLMIAKLELLPEGSVPRAMKSLDALLKVKETEPEIRGEALLLRAGLEPDKKKQFALVDEAAKLAPDRIEAIRARGLLHLEQGHAKEAATDFQRVVKLEPGNASILEALALVQADLKQYDAALANLEKARQLEPDSVNPLTARAQIHVQQKKMKEAMADLNEARAMQPDNLVVLLLRASLYHELGQAEKALADVDRALAIKPNFERARRLRATLLIAAGKLDEVVREIEAIAKASPDDLDVKIQLAMLYTAAKHPEKAIVMFTDILKAHPDNAAALRGRANALLGVGKHAEAIADYNKAIKIEPDEPGMLNNFAWVLCTSPDDKVRDGKRAVKLAQRACELTKYAEAYILSTLAAAYAETGDFDKAVEWSQKALELGKKDQLAEPKSKETDQEGDDLIESLEKELKSFQNKRPWREKLEEGLGPQKSTEGSQDSAKPTKPAPAPRKPKTMTM